MSAGEIVLLGAIAGLTIFLGLPLGRLRTSAMSRLKALLNAIAVGILVFLLWDVLSQAWEPVEEALGHHEIAEAAGNGLVLAVCLGVGLLGLVYYDRWSARRTQQRPKSAGPGAATASELAPVVRRTEAAQLALLIAVGIGLHNFAEGLAIGSSAAAGKLSLAVLLVVGFGLHNATEGFGIVAPLAGSRPSWAYLAMLGLIGGGPTFLGTLVGRIVVNETLSVAFLALAAGSILYVVIELLAVARKSGLKEITTWGVLVGLLLGFATDAVLSAAGS